VLDQPGNIEMRQKSPGTPTLIRRCRRLTQRDGSRWSGRIHVTVSLSPAAAESNLPPG
jgi:hypothetical protein